MEKENLAILGGYLRQIREGQKQSLENVADAIRIRPAVLSAIEEGRMDQLPSMVYARGFVKSYCEYLGASDLWPKFDRNMPVPNSFVAAPAPSNIPPLGNFARPQKFFRRSSVAWIYILLVFAVVGAGYLVWQHRQEVRARVDNPASMQPATEHTPTPPASLDLSIVPFIDSKDLKTVKSASAAPVSRDGGIVSPDSASREPAVVESQDAKASEDLSWMDGKPPVAGAAQQKPQEKLEKLAQNVLLLEAIRPCWISVSQSGKVVESGTMKAGERREIEISSPTRVRFGAPHNMRLVWLEKEYNPLRVLPRPVNILFEAGKPPSDLKAQPAAAGAALQ